MKKLIIFLLILFSPILAQANNIILITVDTLRADHLGCYGYKRNTSPNIDRFSKDAVLFENCFSHAPKTRPSFSNMLSGLLPSQAGSNNNAQGPKKEVNMLAEILKKNGYTTIAVVSNQMLCNGNGFEQGFDIYDDKMEEKELNRNMRERVAEKAVNAAIKYIFENKNNKFFLWLHFQDPHGPYTPPSPFNKLFIPLKKESKILPISNNNSGYRKIPDYQYLKKHYDFNYYESQYDDEIRYVDYELAKFFKFLKERMLYTDSLIIFTADHGEAMGENNYYFCHGHAISPDQIHVPLIVKLSGFRQEHGYIGQVERIVQHRDLLPTILTLAQIEIDEDYKGQFLFDPNYVEQKIIAELGGKIIENKINKRLREKLKALGYIN